MKKSQIIKVAIASILLIAAIIMIINSLGGGGGVPDAVGRPTL